eukprot:2442168-Pleurochrysis_carterae.AAC.1
MPNSSAAGMDSPCPPAAFPACACSAARASRVAAARVSAACTSTGHSHLRHQPHFPRAPREVGVASYSVDPARVRGDRHHPLLLEPREGGARGERYPVVGVHQCCGRVQELHPLPRRSTPGSQRRPVVASAPAACCPPAWGLRHRVAAGQCRLQLRQYLCQIREAPH